MGLKAYPFYLFIDMACKLAFEPMHVPFNMHLDGVDEITEVKHIRSMLEKEGYKIAFFEEVHIVWVYNDENGKVINNNV